MNATPFKQYLKDIRFWILLFFIVRMYGITFPPLEVGHNWRQTDGLMIARNFYEGSLNILYPITDLSEDKPGIVGCEFPILNYCIALVSKPLGFHDWYGRLIVLILSSIATYYFYLLIEKWFSEPHAFYASIILMGSLWFSYSRKTIPDVFAASLCIIAVYFAIQYLEEGKFKNWLPFFLLALLGCLSKILAATLLTVLLFPFLDKSNLKTRKVIFTITAIVILGVVCIWYFYWVPYLQTFGIDQFFMGYSYKESLGYIFRDWPAVSKRFYDTALKYTGFAAFLFGLYHAFKFRKKFILSVFGILFFSYLILLAKTGSSIMYDQYYIITAIPSMAFLAGYGLSVLNRRKLEIFFVSVIVLEGIIDQSSDFRIREPFKSLDSLEVILDNFSQREDLILINSGPSNPTAMYFAHRKGWSVHNEQIQNKDFINDVKAKGCKFIIMLKKFNGEVPLELEVVYGSEFFKIYRL